MAETSQNQAQHETQGGDPAGRPDAEKLGGASGGGSPEVRPGSMVTGSDTPGGGGTQPLEFDDQGHPIKPEKATQPDPQAS